jgi:hypothetical protein
MQAIKVYLDEDVHNLIADALRLRGWKALTTVEAANQRNSDIDQIRFATAEGCIILTYNVRDFPRLHNEILSAGGNHAGIVVATQGRPAANTRALLSLISSLTTDDVANQLIYLNNWIDRSQ